MDLRVERERLHMYDTRRRLVKTTVCIVRADSERFQEVRHSSLLCLHKTRYLGIHNFIKADNYVGFSELFILYMLHSLSVLYSGQTVHILRF
jgi:hypothetical protein